MLQSPQLIPSPGGSADIFEDDVEPPPLGAQEAIEDPFFREAVQEPATL